MKYFLLSILSFTALVLLVALTKDSREESLEQFYEITKNDPLFFDYTLDVYKFNKALAVLKSKEDEFLKTHRGYLSASDREIFPENWRLFPIEFLEKLGEVSAATNAFLEKPSFLKAYALTKLHKEAVQTYKTSARRQLDVINRVIAQSPWYASRQIQFLGSATTLGIVKSDFELILENGKALEEEITRREKCLLKGECKIKIQNAKLKSQNKKGEILKDMEFLPLELLAPFKYEAARGPYFVETGCFGFKEDGTQEEQPFYLFEKEGVLFPKLATENYYLDLKYMEGRWSLADIFLARGVSFDQQSETADYRCADLTYWAKLFKNQLNTLTHFASAVPRFIEFLTLEQQIQKKAPDKLYLMTARTAYSIFYLPFSRSVWRLENSPQYLLAESFPLSSAFTTYSELKAKGYRDEEIKNFNVRQVEALLKELSPLKNQDTWQNVGSSFLRFFNCLKTGKVNPNCDGL